jgi:hypothetical protein
MWLPINRISGPAAMNFHGWVGDIYLAMFYWLIDVQDTRSEPRRL